MENEKRILINRKIINKETKIQYIISTILNIINRYYDKEIEMEFYYREK